MLIAVLNGPNLNLLGQREPEVYGRTTLGEIETMVRDAARSHGAEIEWLQTNHEGQLVDAVQGLRGRVDGALVNAAALTHSSLALRDAMLAVRVPFVELHLSNIFARGPERRHSVIADLAIGLVAGFGAQSYLLALAGEGLDGLLITHLPNVRYLTGFSGSAALLLVHADSTVLVTDFRYAAQAPAEAGEAATVEVDQRSVWDRLGRVLAGLPQGSIGIEARALTVKDAERVAGLTRSRVVPTSDLVERLRAVKSPEEVAAIRTAAELAQDALAEAVPAIRVGRSELEIAAALEGALRRRGSEWHPFPTIVASGPRSALPHARTSARTVERGEWLLLDFGAQVDGYCADLTRTFVVGARADQRQVAMYDLVRCAQARARDHLRPGLTGREGDALARDVIAARGFGEAFGHSLGHGLGLEVHEAPRLAPTSDQPLPEGAVVTVEPGVYFPGWGGVRLEDDLWLGADGAELLSDGRTELVELV